MLDWVLKILLLAKTFCCYSKIFNTLNSKDSWKNLKFKWTSDGFNRNDDNRFYIVCKTTRQNKIFPMLLSILIKSAAKITQDLLLVTSSRSSFRNLPRITKYTAYRDQRDLGVKVVYIKIWNIFIKIRSKMRLASTIFDEISVSLNTEICTSNRKVSTAINDKFNEW